MKRFKILSLLLMVILAVASCKKKIDPAPNTAVTVPPVTPTDPQVAPTIGFMLEDWQSKTFEMPTVQDVAKPVGVAGTTITIDVNDIITKIPKLLYGNNANSWMGPIVTENVLMSHITNLKPNIIRFPGGSISDLYFWNADRNSKPADAPDTLLNEQGNKQPAGYWYGKLNESWTINVDQYYQLLQQSQSTGMIIVNYGYARYGTDADPVARAAQLAANWVRYDNGRTKYWEVGNECNGTWEAGYRINTANNKDGQPEIVNGTLYGKHFKVFADSMRKAAQEIGKTIYIGAYLLEKAPASWQTPTDQTWNTGVLNEVKNTADFYAIHSYFTNYQENSTPDVVLNTATANTKATMDYMKTTLTNAGGSQKPIALTEWNIFSEGSMQMASYINGMHATIVLGELMKNKYGMASRWDLANGWANGNDHGMFNIGDEPGSSLWNPRPPFYYMYYFQRMMGDRLVNTTVSGSDLLAYGSTFSSGQKAVTIVNKSTTNRIATIQLKNATPGAKYYYYTLTGGTDNGQFSRKVVVNGKTSTEASGGPADYKTLQAHASPAQGGIRVSAPARSVVYVVVDK
jgi:hypothetical protein